MISQCPFAVLGITPGLINQSIIPVDLATVGMIFKILKSLKILAMQVACSALAFAIRYPLAYLFFGEIVV